MTTIFPNERNVDDSAKNSPAVSTTRQLARLARKSKLVERNDLAEALSRFSEQNKDAEGRPEALALHLISRQLLTAWQAKMLLQGRWQGFILGKYKLLDQIGAGGMSRVFLGEHLMMKRLVALKVLPRPRGDEDNRIRRFMAESRMTGQLDYRHIVRAFHFDAEKDYYYLVMEYVDGHNLREYVEINGPLPYHKAAQFTMQAADGLSHAHQLDLIHRDVKPANLLVDSKGTVKILDLGLARSLTTADTSLTKSRNGKLLGTPDYIASTLR